jgi:hypothetical protein
MLPLPGPPLPLVYKYSRREHIQSLTRQGRIRIGTPRDFRDIRDIDGPRGGATGLRPDV